MTSLPQKLVEMLKHQGTGAVFTNTEMWFRWRKPQIQTVTKHLFLKRFTVWQNVMAQRHPPLVAVGSPCEQAVTTQAPRRPRWWQPEGGDAPQMTSWVHCLEEAAAEAGHSFLSQITQERHLFGWDFHNETIRILASPADLNGRLKKLLRLESGDNSIAGLSFTSIVSYLDILFQFFQEHLFVVVIDINLLALINEIIIL